MNAMFRFGAGLAVLAFTLTTNADVPVPAPGASARIDAIKKAGVLRVGVLANAPWLVENTSGSGEAWSGPAWLLAKEYAKRLNADRKSTRLNSSHGYISYAVFCLKKKKKTKDNCQLEIITSQTSL